tara:strand:- start:322 stop:432 length:111 start_codon:yes stop_codon:yes gene_type:complete
MSVNRLLLDAIGQNPEVLMDLSKEKRESQEFVLAAV